jgi:hypothetical protein
MRKIRAGKIAIDSRAWLHLTNDATDLLLRFLRMNPANRITCEAALNHRWFKLAND